MGLKALHVDQEYIQAMAAAGYPELRANKLTEMKAVGVPPEKVMEATTLGFHPTEQEEYWPRPTYLLGLLIWERA